MIPWQLSIEFSEKKMREKGGLNNDYKGGHIAGAGVGAEVTVLGLRDG